MGRFFWDVKHLGFYGAQFEVGDMFFINLVPVDTEHISIGQPDFFHQPYVSFFFWVPSKSEKDILLQERHSGIN